ncbi:MAG: hypothetical protein BWK76_10000 [Desulfobulbaceae bacterium A2]|nr:MAG: hypothetical protein BWK76_10000 [Desulfobulbaceae bacterium A2]
MSQLSISPARASWLCRLGWCLSSCPALLLVTLLTHALHVRLLLGRWPLVYRDDPHTTLLAVHDYALLLLFFLNGAAIPLGLVWGLVTWRLAVISRRTWLGQVALLGLGVTAIAAWGRYDGSGYIAWLLD